jgi:undecaprenyl-phosphate galactose phosphotransferase
LETILTVRPGITGLWQVSGRSDVDFVSRIELDTWYIRNWNLWMDLVILIKTIKTVLFKDGAK